ncbi:MAG: amidohydrolase [Pseudomonadota bacterium]
MPIPLSFNAVHALLLAALLGGGAAAAQTPADGGVAQLLEQRVRQVAPKVVAWRRDIHQHPELSGQEVRTAGLVAGHLRALGMAVSTGVGGNGVVGVLSGDLPGKVVALRADMDALPVQEATGLPFASTVTAKNMGRDSPVMHACGHDAHTAILMGVAEALAGMKSQIHGTVKFIFQPAEEGYSAPPGEAAWGAKAMVAAGAMDHPRVDAIFALHMAAALPAGTIGWRSGPTLAGADTVHITVIGKQSHGAAPWLGIDPIVTAAQMVGALQTVVSRSLDITREPVVFSIGAINGGTRHNIVPDKVEMTGTLRTYDEAMRARAVQRIVAIVQGTAAANNAQGRVDFEPTYSVTDNPAPLTAAMLPTLRYAAGGQVAAIPRVSGSEDFSEYQKVAPGLFFMLGGKPANATVGPNHSPTFDLDETALPVGVRSLALLALDYLADRRRGAR